MKKAKEILSGWKNALIPDDAVDAIAKQRLDVCNTCEHKTTMLGMDCCGLCHCPLLAKTKSPNSKCPCGKWKF